MLTVNTRNFLYRCVAFLAGLSVFGIGITPMLRHKDVLYTNWFGQLVEDRPEGTHLWRVVAPSRESLTGACCTYAVLLGIKYR
jgi:kynureninase